jgi:hypothetical protein
LKILAIGNARNILTTMYPEFSKISFEYDRPFNSRCINDAITKAGKPIQSAYLFRISNQFSLAAFVRENSIPAKITRKSGSMVLNAVKKESIRHN